MDDVSKRVEHVTLRENTRSEETARGTRDQPYRNFERRVRSPMVLRLSRFCRSAQDDLCGTFKTVIEAILCSGDANGSGLCSVKLLNDGGCRSET